MKDITPPTLVCRQCAAPMARFAFRCAACGAWDSAAALEDAGERRAGAGVARPAARRSEP